MSGDPYGAPSSNRNQFYPPDPSGYYASQSKYMPPNPKYSKNYSKYYQHSGGAPPSLPPHLAGLDHDQDPASGAYPPPPHRFNPNFHYAGGPNQYRGGPYPPSAHHYAAMYNAKSGSFAHGKHAKDGDNSSEKEKNSGASDNDAPHSGAEDAEFEIDSELTNAVAEITSAIATASASGKELTLTQEQQLTLQKHQLLVQQQQQLRLQQKQAQQAALQMQQQMAGPGGASLKKFPNYRLLGRNIFDGGVKQQFFKKKVFAIVPHVCILKWTLFLTEKNIFLSYYTPIIKFFFTKWNLIKYQNGNLSQ